MCDNIILVLFLLEIVIYNFVTVYGIAAKFGITVSTFLCTNLKAVRLYFMVTFTMVTSGYVDLVICSLWNLLSYFSILLSTSACCYHQELIMV